MTEPVGHTVTIDTGFSKGIMAPVLYVKDLGNKRALVHLETNYHIDDNRDHKATYSTGGKEAKGKYRVSAKVFTSEQTYIYMGIFTREE